jgi:hypothetical protein
MRLANIAVAIAFVILAAALFFWIPGVAIVLVAIALVLALTAFLVPPVATKNRSLVVFAGAGIALLGVLAIPFLSPLVGLMLMLAGGAIAIAPSVIATIQTILTPRP